MSIESDDDLAGVREAGRVTTEALDVLAAHAVAGVTTAELDSIASDVLARHGARSAPAIIYGFPGTVLISVNDEIVHGVPGSRRLQSGDLVSLDVTVEKDGFIADAARSIVVGKASRLARQLIEAAERSLAAGLTVARAGIKVNEIGRAVQSEVRRYGFDVVRGLCGHGVGRTIHEPPDVPNEFDRRQREVLTDGLVLTIEPMLSAGARDAVLSADGWTLRTADGSLSAHCEHTILIRNGAPLVLAA